MARIAGYRAAFLVLLASAPQMIEAVRTVKHATKAVAGSKAAKDAEAEELDKDAQRADQEAVAGVAGNAERDAVLDAGNKANTEKTMPDNEYFLDVLAKVRPNDPLLAKHGRGQHQEDASVPAPEAPPEVNIGNAEDAVDGMGFFARRKALSRMEKLANIVTELDDAEASAENELRAESTARNELRNVEPHSPRTDVQRQIKKTRQMTAALKIKSAQDSYNHYIEKGRSACKEFKRMRNKYSEEYTDTSDLKTFIEAFTAGWMEKCPE